MKEIQPHISRSCREIWGQLLSFILDDVVTDPSLMLADHLHPNAEGVKIVVQGLAPLVEAALPAAG